LCICCTGLKAGVNEKLRAAHKLRHPRGLPGSACVSRALPVRLGPMAPAIANFFENIAARAPQWAREARALPRKGPACRPGNYSSGGSLPYLLGVGLAIGKAKVDPGEADGAGELPGVPEAGVVNSGATEGDDEAVGVGDALGVGVGNGGIMFSQ
jgi:hypothetical protein